MINRPPEVVSFAIDPHENLVQMPAPLSPISVRGDSLLPDLRGEHRTRPVPSGTYRLVADINPTFMEQILDLPRSAAPVRHA